jgi:hypothetical protein
MVPRFGGHFCKARYGQEKCCYDEDEARDCKAYDTLISLLEKAPRALLADKGYDADAIRTDLAHRNSQAVIPGGST